MSADPTGPRPNLFLIGVQRSATTALWTYLAEHPEVFMATKELHFFGRDLAECNGVVDPGTRLTLDEYLARFARATGQRYLGDASVGYVYSATAAGEIKAFSPEARVLASFRNPVDMAYSVYGLLKFQGLEPAPDFASAFADVDTPRWAWTNGGFKWGFTYERLVRYTEQLERYFAAFGRQRVHVTVYEDLKADAASAYRSVLEFLEVDPSFRPDLGVVFANRRVRSDLLQRALWESPNVVKKAVRLLLPKQATRRRIGTRLAERNKQVAPQPALPTDVRRALEEQLGGEVDRFSELLGRDMRALWFGGAETGPIDR